MHGRGRTGTADDHAASSCPLVRRARATLGLADDVAGLHIEVTGMHIEVAGMHIEVAGTHIEVARTPADVSGDGRQVAV